MELAPRSRAHRGHGEAPGSSHSFSAISPNAQKMFVSSPIAHFSQSQSGRFDYPGTVCGSRYTNSLTFLVVQHVGFVNNTFFLFRNEFTSCFTIIPEKETFYTYL